MLSKKRARTLLMHATIMHAMMRPYALFLHAVLWLGFATPPLRAASISGVVSDAEGAALAGAQITARQAETAVALSSISREDGSYLLDPVPAGVYTITIQRAGFAELTQENVRAGENGDVVRLNFQLRPAHQRSNPRTAAARGQRRAAARVSRGAELLWLSVRFAASLG
jgi:hypothetical protein